MNDISKVPESFQEFDTSKLMLAQWSGFSHWTRSLAEHSLVTVAEVVDKLTQTYQLTAVSGSSWWFVLGGDDTTSVWFPTIAEACYIINYWTFWILCVMHIRQLREDYPRLRAKEVLLDGEEPESQTISDKLKELSTRIMLSMDFFLQDEMKLCGIVSAALPSRWLVILWRRLTAGTICPLVCLEPFCTTSLERVTKTC